MLLMIATAFTACKKSDTESTPAQKLVGKWKEVGATGWGVGQVCILY